MKRFLLSQAVMLLSFITLSTAFSQSTDYLSRAYDFVKTQYSLDQKALGELKIKDQYVTDHNQVVHVHLVQAHNGIEIFGTSINLAFLPDGKISSVSHRLTILDGHHLPGSSPSISAPEAIGIVAKDLGITTRSIPSVSRVTPKGVTIYSKEDISLQDIPAELGYLNISGEYQLVWKMQIDSRVKGEMYQSIVNANTGAPVSNDKLTLHCSFENGFASHEDQCDDHASLPFLPQSPPPTNAVGQYRVLPVGVESPLHGNFELISGAEDPVASPFGWHDTDGAAGNEYTITRGNNVHAFLDRNWDYSPDKNLDGGANLLFDFPYTSSSEPSGNEDVSVTNLFFWNNVMHDFSYKYGFNEVAGNFQTKNYGGQGAEDDHVEAHAQFGDDNPTQCGTEVNGDVGCINNADFASGVDGSNGRMRMFTWDRDNSSKFLDVLEPVELAGKILTGLADFGTDITMTPVTGDVVIADDGSVLPTHGCNTLAGQTDVAGKIVIIDRGICDFSLKVFNAQEGGAIGAIICNFEEVTIGMASGEMGEDVTIPSVFITRGDCERIRVAVANGLRVSLVAPVSEGGPVRRDGSLDNSIIAHEFGHGISTRLTGGPSLSHCLTPNALTGEAEEAWGMGEGWSDFFSLVTTVREGDTGAKRRGIGTYANKENVDGRGIRSFPYSTDMTINSHTYDDILFESIPHGVGSVWTAMLWDLYWALTDAYGWDPDIYNGTGGNNIAIQLVMDGLKMQDCNPGFIDARNAILQADQINNNGVNECLIWEVFARRGLGWNADGGDKNLRSDGIEGFESLPTCVKELKLSKTMTPEITAGDQIEVTLTATNHTGTQLTNVFLEDLIPEGTTYVPGSANIAPATGNSLVWTIDEMDQSEEIIITYLLQSDPAKISTRMIYDDIEGDALDRWEVLFDEGGATNNLWAQQDVIVYSGVSAWNVGDVAVESKHYLQNYDPFEVNGDQPVYRFYHYYNTEAGADGGYLSISTDGGNIWHPLQDKIFRNGYPRKLQYTTFAIPDLYAYSGLSNTVTEMTPVYIDLSDYAGQDVHIRFTFGTDENTPGDGWYVDDVEIMDAILYNSSACITSDQTNAVCAEAPAHGTIVDSQIMTASEDEYEDESLALLPNPANDFVQVVLTMTSAENAVVNVFDLRGQQLFSAKWKLNEGINQQLIPLDNYSSGMYVVHISTDKGVISKKFIKQ